MIIKCNLLICSLLLMTTALQAQNTQNQADQEQFDDGLKTYIIERDMPGAGDLTAPDLKSISQQSCSVLKLMGPEIQWLESYFTDDKIYCKYKASNEQLLKLHAEKGGFPITKIMEIRNTIGPSTATEK